MMIDKLNIIHYLIKAFIISSLLAFSIQLNGQIVFESLNNKPLYDFLDELASEKIITLNSCIKPYSRQFIFDKLFEAKSKSPNINKRQKKELESYLSIFSIENNAFDTINQKTLFGKKTLGLLIKPISLQYRDSNFRLFIQPIIGRSYIVRDDKQFQYHNTVGASTFAYLGKNIGVYADLTDHYLYKYVFPMPEHLSLLQGGSYKINNGSRKGADYSEMIGGINYSWKWGSVGIVKDNLIWGDNLNGSNIFSGRTPSFGMIQLKMSPARWIDFNYFHGWLPSMVIDSSRSYVSQNGIQRNIYRDKYIAANMISIQPFKNLYFSMGNSIIYSDKSFQIGYLIPFMFYKSIDHSLTMGTENENSQMFFNISSRNIKHVHLFASYFIDEWSFKRISDKSSYNFTSGKIGINLTNFPIKNLSIGAEYTQTSPMTFKHRLETTTFGTNNYNFGHYMGSNSRDFFACITYKPIPMLKINFSGNIAQKYNDYEYVLIPNKPVDSYPVMQDIIWEKREFVLRIDWTIFKNTYLHIGFNHSQITGFDVDNKTALDYLTKFSPDFYFGNRNFYFFGVNLGF